MHTNDGKGLWEGHTSPVVVGPEKNLGGEAEVTPFDPSPKLLFKNDGSSIYSYTLTCNLGLDDIHYPEEGATPRHGNVLAFVEWGQGAASFSAEIDMKTGTQFTVVATAIKVSAKFDPEETRDDGLIISARAKGAIVWGTRPARALCTRTQRRVIAAGGSAIVPIPAFAESLKIASSVPGVMTGAVGPVSLRFLGGPLATDLALLAASNAAGFFQNAIIAFPGGCYFLEATNGSAVPIDLSFVWALSL